MQFAVALEQILLDVAHRFSRSRIQFKEAPAYRFYSAAAERHLHSPLGTHLEFDPGT